jgi:glyoxylase-like metal-dependent hydrolase (beta-lactamase superfamily II)
LDDEHARGVSRRAFLAAAGSCAGHLALAMAAGTAGARRLFAAIPAGTVCLREPWGRIERLAEEAWALVSTPLAGGDEATRTFSNGGIVAGRDGVLVIEGLASEPGAEWLAGKARELTGRGPDWIVLTHYHGDHSSGLAGYEKVDRPTYVTTAGTRAELARRATERGGSSSAVEALESDRTRLVADDPLTIDLGGRTVRVVPRAGHTRSDLVVVLEDPRLVWCGDLAWNGLFPNYVDAVPTVLSRHVRALLEEPAELWVPGHGSLADRAALGTYLALLDDLEAAARRALEAGIPLDVAARDYRPPSALGEWVLFSPRYYEVAMRAWERELGQAGGPAPRPG